ncbi:MAG: cytochrome b, partial [Lysobacteraceae bacterium]
LAHSTPPPVAGTPRWQQRSSSVTHAMLYAMMFVMPISGWLFNSAANFPLKWYGLFTVPALSGPDPLLKHRALEVHEIGFYVLAALLLLHIGAALKHHFLDKDATLARMLPAGWVPDPSLAAAQERSTSP